MTNKITDLELVVSEIQGMEPKFAQTLPAHVPSKRFVRTCLMAVQANPKLLEANKMSLYTACLKSAADGLVLDGREAALVIFKGIVQYMPMVAGIIKKVRNTGDLASISAHVVYENDKYKHTLAPVESFEHTSVPLTEDRGKKIGVYAVATLKSGEQQFCVMREDEVLAVKKIAKTGMVWDGPFGDQMWEKTAIRRLCKRLPSSSELDRLFENDNLNYEMPPGTGVESEVSPNNPGGMTSTARKILRQADAEAAPDDTSDAEADTDDLNREGDDVF